MTQAAKLLKRYNAYREVFAAPELQPAGWWARVVLAVAAALLPAGAQYRTLFRGVFIRVVLADLQTFCRAYTSTFDPERPEVIYTLEGRREVYNRIVNFTHMDPRFLRELREEADSDV
jgi:hypothetical protein